MKSIIGTIEKRGNINRKENSNFWSSALSLQGSITPKVYKNVLLCLAYAIVVSLVYYKYPLITLPVSPFEYAGVVMGLSLVFRINSGYDRWWEARKLWGSIVNATRNIAILVKSYGDKNDPKVNSTLGLITVMPILMKNHLRAVTNTEEIKEFLSSKDYEEIQQWQHRPNYVSLRIAEHLSLMYDEQQINEFAFLKAEELRQSLMDCQGACERILKTPMPLVMAIKIRRFIFLFLLILPIALAGNMIMNCIITTVVSYAFFSLDQIGIELQNPFAVDNLSHLPLNDICGAIKKDVAEIVNREDFEPTL